jgi:hypothetical protein
MSEKRQKPAKRTTPAKALPIQLSIFDYIEQQILKERGARQKGDEVML